MTAVARVQDAVLATNSRRITVADLCRESRLSAKRCRERNCPASLMSRTRRIAGTAPPNPEFRM